MEQISRHDSQTCKICEAHKKHKVLYTETRQAYEQDKLFHWTEKDNIFTVDMQKVFILPKMSQKDAFFVSRLIVMNETFAPLHIGENKCILWHEAITGRSAPAIVSTFYKVITSANPKVNNFLFWADNCAAQNKNWVLFTSLVMFVNYDWGPEKITVKYFEPGHSYMKADAVHGKIGKEWNNRKEILTMNDVVDVINKAEKKNQAVQMTVADFFDYTDGSRQRSKNDKGNKIIPLLAQVKIAEFRKGSRNLFYKESFTTPEFKECLFLKKNFQLILPDRQKEPKGLNTRKKETIVSSLLPHMPARKRLFWKNIPTNDEAYDMCDKF